MDVFSPIIKGLKKYPLLYLSFLIVLLITSSFNVEMISGFLEEIDWCSPNSNVCQVKVRIIAIFAVVLLGIFFQFVIPKLIQQYKKWANKEEDVDFDIVDEIRSPYYVLFARSRTFPFIFNVNCGIEVFPEVDSLSDSELRNTYSTAIRLPIDNFIWF